MTASTNDAQTRPPSWVCISPHTCVRCSDDVVVGDQTFLFNKFACSCAFVENGAPCVHQEIIDEYKSKIFTSENGSKNSEPTHESQPSTSTSASYRKPIRYKSKRKNQPAHHHQASPIFNSVDYQEMKSLLQSPASNTSTTLSINCEFNKRLTTDWGDNSICNRTESSTSSSSSSSTTTTSRSSSSDSCNSSSTSSSSIDQTSGTSNTTSESNDDVNEANISLTAAQVASKMRRRRGYKIMVEERLKNSCVSSDENDSKSSTSVGSDSDDSSIDGSTSASSDNSWWQTYEREKDLLFLKKNDLMTKDSGYVSTTSPNTDSTKTDD